MHYTPEKLKDQLYCHRIICGDTVDTLYKNVPYKNIFDSVGYVLYSSASHYSAYDLTLVLAPCLKRKQLYQGIVCERKALSIKEAHANTVLSDMCISSCLSSM